MAFDPDSVLLDRLFQPAADRLADRLSCFGLSRLALAGAVSMQIAVLAADLQAEGNFALRIMAVLITVLALIAAQQARQVIVRAERQARPGTMNLRRITMRWQRAAWLAISIWALTVLLGRGTAGNLAVVGACFAWLSCLYFLACSPAPPCARATRPVHAFAS